MRHIFSTILGSVISLSVFAEEPIKVTIESLTNTSSGGSMEACGTASHSAGKKPLLVTIKHDQSYYTTLTAPNGVWCSVIKRWTYDGSIEAGATTLDSSDKMTFQSFKVNEEK